MTSMKPHLLCLSLVAMAALASEAIAEVPKTVTVQGRVFGKGGKPVDGGKTLTFRIYESAQGGTGIWQEQHVTVLKSGWYAIELGSLAPLGDTLVGAKGRWLGVTVDGDGEMLPRTPLRSVPYAMVAGDVTGAIHPQSVSVAGKMVIDAKGNWVGPPQSSGGSVSAVSVPVGGACKAGGVELTVDGKKHLICNGVSGSGGGSVSVAVEPKGANCAHGGTKLVVGAATSYACNGAPGTKGETGPKGDAGPKGDVGPKGADGQGVSVSPEPKGNNCVAGGVKIVAASGTSYVCNGAAGTGGGGTSGTGSSPTVVDPNGAVLGKLIDYMPAADTSMNSSSYDAVYRVVTKSGAIVDLDVNGRLVDVRVHYATAQGCLPGKEALVPWGVYKYHTLHGLRGRVIAAANFPTTSGQRPLFAVKSDASGKLLTGSCYYYQLKLNQCSSKNSKGNACVLLEPTTRKGIGLPEKGVGPVLVKY